MTIDMEKVLHHVERNLGTSLLDPQAWEIFREYVARAQGTIVNKRDLAGLLELVYGQQQQMQQQQLLLQQQQLQQPIDSLQDNYYGDLHDAYQEDLLQRDQRDQQDLNEEQYQDGSISETEAASAPAPLTGATSMPALPLSYHSRSSQPIRRITLQTSSSYPRLRSSFSNNTLADDPEFSLGHHLTSPQHDARSTSSGRSPSPVALSHNAEEYVGYGNDAEPDHIDQDDFMRMKKTNADLDRKLKRAQQEYALRLDEQIKENNTHQQEIERLSQDLRKKCKEINDLKHTEKSQSKQIREFEEQILLHEKTTLTQKNGAAALKRQKDELENEKKYMQETLRQKEKEVEDLAARIKILEDESRKIVIDQSHMEELQARLAAEITKNQVMARELEAIQEERRRLQSENEQLGGSGGIDLELSAVFAAGVDVSANTDQEARSRSLWSELSGHRKEFEKPLESEPATPSAAAPPVMPGAWGSATEDATKLLQESSQNSAQFATFKKKYEMKRSSLRDLSQLYQDHAKLRQDTSADSHQPTQQDTQRHSSATAAARREEHSFTEHNQQTVDLASKKTVSFGSDDVDCSLPDQLRPLSVKMDQLGKEHDVTDSLLDDIAKQLDPHTVSLAPLPFQRIHRESMRRRKPQASRAVTQAELDELRGQSTAGATTVQATGEMVSPESTSTNVARREINTKMIANATLLSMYTIIVYLFGMITSVFLVDSGQTMMYGRNFNLDTIQAVAHQENGGRRVGVIEVLVLWIHNLVFRGDGLIPS
ncbi:hypothetical protein BGW42_002966 [Actinomortierella wolfii]|nr:hypothetical protein BGW42_002966 [Actinomortierella wolfii]